jgi:hypothetical protein
VQARAERFQLDVSAHLAQQFQRFSIFFQPKRTV